MSELNADQKYQILMRLVSVVEAALSPQRVVSAKEAPAVLPKKPQDSQYLDPEMEDALSRMVGGLLKPIETVKEDTGDGV